MTKVSAVVLAWLDEPWLEKCVDALLSSEGADVEVIIVDNGCTDGAVDRLDDRHVRVLRPSQNLGFAGGCNFGAQHASGSALAFVNSDAIVTPSTIRELVRAISPPDVAIASASVRLADQPDRISSAGNPIQFLGFSWGGAGGEAADAHQSTRMIAAASGSCMGIRHEVWDQLEGFCEPFFAYQEDAELSWRAWMSGLKVVFAPQAVVFHHYDPSRNPQKRYLVERNRIVFLLTLYEARTLALLAPAFVVAEIGMLVVATVQGWLPEKLRGLRWLIGQWRWLRERRSRVQRARKVPDRELARLLAAALPVGLAPRPIAWIGNPLLVAYWALVRRALNLGRGRKRIGTSTATETEDDI